MPFAFIFISILIYSKVIHFIHIKKLVSYLIIKSIFHAFFLHFLMHFKLSIVFILMLLDSIM
jgi:hypothetical protein